MGVIIIKWRIFYCSVNDVAEWRKENNNNKKKKIKNKNNLAQHEPICQCQLHQ